MHRSEASNNDTDVHHTSNIQNDNLHATKSRTSGLKFREKNPQDRGGCSSKFLMDQNFFYKTRVKMKKNKTKERIHVLQSLM